MLPAVYGNFQISLGAGEIAYQPGWMNKPFGFFLSGHIEDHWSITHLPTGANLSSVAGLWANPESAAEAVCFLKGLSNNWEQMEPAYDAEYERMGRRIKTQMSERFPGIIFSDSRNGTMVDGTMINGYNKTKIL